MTTRSAKSAPPHTFEPSQPDSARLERENFALRQKLAQLEETLGAIRRGEVDALLVPSADGERLFTLTGADRTYRALIEEMGEGALTLTPDGVVAYANQRFAELLQRPLSRVIGSRIEDCFAAEDRSPLAMLFGGHQLGKRSAEMSLLAASGVKVPTLLSVSPLSVEGISDALCVVVTDISEQKRSEAAIRARKQSLLEMIESQRRTQESLQASLNALRLRDSALGAISQGVLISDAHGNTTYANQACVDMTGYSAQELTGHSSHMLEGPDTSPVTLRAMRSALSEARPFQGELLSYRKDGTPFWNELSIMPVFDNQGVPMQFVGVMRDVTQQRETQAQLLLAGKVFEQSSEGLFVADARSHILKINPAFTRISGFAEADVLGQNANMLSSSRHDAVVFESIMDEIAQHGRWQGEAWGRRKDGSDYQQWLSMSRVVDANGQGAQYIASFSDITQRKDAEESIRRLAHFDPLTGLPNRALLAERAAMALQIARRSLQSMALMFIDLDQFKRVNDSLGHSVGDRLLMAMAARFKHALREQDTLARTGGDEFVLLLPGTDANGAAHVAQKLLQLTQLPYPIDPHELTITPSIGIAVFPSDGSTYDALAKCADAAMYRAKQSGRNGYRFYTAELHAQSARVLLVENALRRALERGQMRLYYQPQVSLRSSQIVGVEALLRWNHPELGWVSPIEFIPIAESSGLIAPIGEWVLRTAVQQLSTWHSHGIAALTMAVNLSAVQFQQQNLPELVGRVLDEANIPAHRLKLELTESVASDDPTGALALTERLHALGVFMSIDDFGTGYSSLSYLKRFRIYQLKIDQSFVRGVAAKSDDQVIVSAILGLATSLGLRTIAEGVETEEQMRYLASAGCDEMQGYYFSQPLPAEQFEALIESGVWQLSQD